MLDGLLLMTRFNTALARDGWIKLVVWPAPILKLCQLMIALWLLVTLSVFAFGVAKVAVPDTTVGPCGLASTQVLAIAKAIVTIDLVQLLVILLSQGQALAFILLRLCQSVRYCFAQGSIKRDCTSNFAKFPDEAHKLSCLLYTSDAADE